MNISDLAKLILFVGLTVSCVGISVQIMRLLSAVTDNIKDLRKTVKNIGTLTDGFVKDHELITEGIESLVAVVKKIKGIVNLISKKIIEPIAVIFGFLSSINNFFEGVSQKFGKKRE